MPSHIPHGLIWLTAVLLLLIGGCAGYRVARWVDRFRYYLRQEREKQHAELMELLRPWRPPPAQYYHPQPTAPRLIITPRCPEGYSAKNVLGYRDLGGQKHPHIYPGGFDRWNAVHGIITDTEDE